MTARLMLITIATLMTANTYQLAVSELRPPTSRVIASTARCRHRHRIVASANAGRFSTLTLRQDTLPSSSVVSDVTDDQDAPPSLVPASATDVPAPVAQQCVTLTQEIELNQPVLSKVCAPAQVAPPSCEEITMGPAALGAAPAAAQVGIPLAPRRQDRLMTCCRPASAGSADRLQLTPPSVGDDRRRPVEFVEAAARDTGQRGDARRRCLWRCAESS